MLNHILKRDNGGSGNTDGMKLVEWSPLCNLPKRYQEEIISRSEIIDIPAETFIFRFNDNDDKDYYLLSGKVELSNRAGSHIENITDNGEKVLQILDSNHPRKCNAKTTSNCQIFVTRRTFHDTLNANGASKQHAIPELEVDEIDFESSGNWMLSMLNAGVFSNLPPESMQQLFISMENLNVLEGDIIINEGGNVDYYYLIQHGKCALSQNAEEGEKELCILSGGDTFGSSALISDSLSTFQVEMMTDGILMRMPKDCFNELIKKPLLTACSVQELKALEDSRTCLLDIRTADQYKISAINNSTNIPLESLAAALKSLSMDKQYIICGESDTEAMVGAFQLAEKNFAVRYLSVSVDAYLATNVDEGFSLQQIKDQEAPGALEVTGNAPPAEEAFEITKTPSQIQIDPDELNDKNRDIEAEKISNSLQSMSVELEKQIRKELNELYNQKKKELEDEINLRFKKYHLVTAQLLKKKTAELKKLYTSETTN